MAKNINPKQVEALIREAAKKHILPYYGKLDNTDVQSKAHAEDLQTIADLESEKFLTRELSRLFPGSHIIGEESTHDEPARLDLLKDKETISWVIDPVDGTYNFRHKKRHFGLILACVIDGKTQYGWIYDILGDDMLFTARGRGAFINGKPVSTAPEKPLSELSGYASISGKAKKIFKDARAHLKEITTLRCSAHEYLNIVQGNTDFAVYTHLKPWDHLAGTLAVEEAGGYVAKLDGSPYTTNDQEGVILIASRKGVWQKLASKLNHYDIKPPGNKPE